MRLSSLWTFVVDAGINPLVAPESLLTRIKMKADDWKNHIEFQPFKSCSLGSRGSVKIEFLEGDSVVGTVSFRYMISGRLCH